MSECIHARHFIEVRFRVGLGLGIGLRFRFGLGLGLGLRLVLGLFMVRALIKCAFARRAAHFRAAHLSNAQIDQIRLTPQRYQ